MHVQPVNLSHGYAVLLRFIFSLQCLLLCGYRHNEALSREALIISYTVTALQLLAHVHGKSLLHSMALKHVPKGTECP